MILPMGFHEREHVWGGAFCRVVNAAPAVVRAGLGLSSARGKGVVRAAGLVKEACFNGFLNPYSL